MSIEKKYLKSKPECRVTFSLLAKDAKKVEVAGSFNEWNGKKLVLKKYKNGKFKGSLNLPVNQSYEFKYIIDGTWANEEGADEYIWNEFANSENSVIRI